MDKKKLLHEFINRFKDLPAQRSKQWLSDRKFSIGGSEMSTIVGYNPYKNIRGLIEGHLELTTFNGNINTYWGSILEDLVTLILTKKWNCKIYETGSLPGVIESQKYSPDGLVYLDFLDKIVLLEIKCAARRIANGKLPRMYKPQIFTGMDTIPLADMGLFVDALFRRCSVKDLAFNSIYDAVIHPDKPLGSPLALCAVCIYEDVYSTSYDNIKTKYVKSKSEWIDAGNCCQEDLEFILRDTIDGKLRFFMPEIVENENGNIDQKTQNCASTIFEEFKEYILLNNCEPIAILPLKLFKLELIPVYRDDWKKTYNRRTRKWEMPDTPTTQSYVQTHQETIETVVNQIKQLDTLNPDDQLKELDKLYPPPYTALEDMDNDTMLSMVS